MSSAPFDAGKISRRDLGFVPRGLGPNAAAETGNLPLVRARMRSMLDNNALIDGGVEAFCDYVVGLGITLEPDTGDAEINDALRPILRTAFERVDPERQMALHESQRLMLREIKAAGEVLVFYPTAPEFGEFPAMPAVELIDAERMPIGLTGVYKGNQVRQGIEYDRYGRTVAYHVLVEHPDDGTLPWLAARKGASALEGLAPGLKPGSVAGLGLEIAIGPTVRIPASMAELAFKSRRVGQCRGVPDMVSAMTTVRTEDAFRDDCVIQARTAAGFSVVLELPNSPRSLFTQTLTGSNGVRETTEAAMVDPTGRPVYELGAGVVTCVAAGTKVTTINPQLSGPNFVASSALMQRIVGRGMRMPSSVFTGDSTEASFSSLRAEHLDGRKAFRPWMQFVVDHHTSGYARRIVRWAVLTGRVRLTPEQRVRIGAGEIRLDRFDALFPGFEYSNPKQEAEADEIGIRAGVVTRQTVCAERGADWRRVIRESVAWEVEERAQRRAAGLPETPAPRGQTGQSGQDGGTGPGAGDGEQETRKNRRATVDA